MYGHILVPLDGSELATNLVTQAVEFAGTLGARVTFFTMREDYSSSSEGALVRTMSPDVYAEVAVGEANAIIAKAMAAARALKLACEGVVRTGTHAHELILQVAAERGCDLIYMASHGRRGLKALLPGSQTQKVLAHTTLPVLVATVETNVASSASEAAIAIIKDEHRTIAAVIHGLRLLAARLRGGDALELDLLEQMLHYIRSYPEALHHPKEEQYLFARLAQRTGETAGLIATLVAQHREGDALLAELEVQAASLREGGAAGAPGNDTRARLADTIDRFVDAQWQHLSTEEKLILPAAQRHLTDADWLAIEAAFRANGELRRGGPQDEAYKRLFTRLMNLAAERRAA